MSRIVDIEPLLKKYDGMNEGTEFSPIHFINDLMALEQQPTDARETIIKSALKYLVKMQIEQGSVGFAVDNDHDHDCTWDDVLAWIEAQPTDAVSREAVLDIIDFEDEWLFDAKSYNADTKIAFSAIKSKISELPSVTPKYTDEEIDKAQAVEQAYIDKMVELAVEETKRPKGKWIKIEYDVCTFIYKCSKCGMRVVNPYKYCPICGAEMDGGGEDGAETR